jgi:cold shock CspA family protein
MSEGTVSHVVLQRGFGFIRQTAGPDLFFHCHDVCDDLAFDDQLVERRVAFNVQSTPKGLRAVDVTAEK